MGTQVGGAFVRIRPYVSEDDARTLAALRDLSRDLAAAFDRFEDVLQGPSGPPAKLHPSTIEGETP